MKRIAPAATRNTAPILDQLRRLLPADGLVLEIASGTGQHAAAFAAALPSITWQPSDADPDALASIAAHVADAGLANLRAPLALDVAAASWPVDRADAIFNANMIHIAPWSVCQGLLAGAGRILSAGAPLIMYGPYLMDDRETAPSNLAFDQSLRDRDPSWGVRRLRDVEAEAAGHALRRVEVIDMPANNVIVVYRRD